MHDFSWYHWVGIAIVLVTLVSTVNDYRRGRLPWPKVKVRRGKDRIPYC